MRIATWNVSSMLNAGELDNKMEIERTELDILKISNVQRPEPGQNTTKKGVFHQSDTRGTNHLYSIGMGLNQKAQQSVIKVESPKLYSKQI